MKIKRVLLNLGLTLSLGFGIYQFFVPMIFKWTKYIPNNPPNLFVSIIWANYFYSLFLVGYTVLLFLFQRKIIGKNLMGLIFYGFFVVIWFIRIICTFILPLSGMYDLIFFIELIFYIIVFVLLVVPFGLLLNE